MDQGILDTIDQVYWWPPYAGLISISQKFWRKGGDRISVPAALVNRSGPLYSRERKAAELHVWMHSQEEPLNHIFDLTFSIAADEAVRSLLFSELGIEEHENLSLDRPGRSIKDRYGWGNVNVTQPDGMFLSDTEAVCVELKLGSPSSPMQIVKYACMLLMEEDFSKTKKELGLLFIVPASALGLHWQKCGLDGPKVDIGIVDRLGTKAPPAKIQEILQTRMSDLKDVMSRMRLAAVSWSDFDRSFELYLDKVGSSEPGDATLRRLLEGFKQRLRIHQGTEV